MEAPLFDYATTLSASKPPSDISGRRNGDCNLEFLAPASVMQVHTLVAATANGIRYKNKCAVAAVSPGSAAGDCLRDTAVIASDVLAYVPWFHREAPDVLGEALGIQLLAMPIVGLLFFPIMTTTFGNEKRHGLLEMMKIQSLDLGIYWFSNYVWFFLLSQSVSLLYLFLFYATANNFDWGNFFAITLLWGHAQISLALLVAAFFWRSESLTAITYFVMLFTLGSSMELGEVVPTPYPTLLIMFPPTNYIRSLRLCLKYRDENDAVSMADLMTESEKNEWTELMLCQFFIPCLVIFISIALLMDYHVKAFQAIVLKYKMWRK